MKNIDLNKLGRNFLRVCGMVIIVFYMVFRIIIPLFKNEPIYLDVNDGYVLTGAMALILCVEAVRAYVKSKIPKE